MSTTTQKEAAALAGTSDWPGSPLSTVHHIVAQARQIPLEQYPEGSAYVFRFEVPDIDPTSSISVSVAAGMLTVRAERLEEAREDRTSEFRYGTLSRSVPLPPGSDAHNASASYHNGILTVRIGLDAEYQGVPHALEIVVEP
jgi:HSP20 family protein